MRYSSFDILNFKGIKSAKVILPKEDSTAVALIGLNESGKTTILQAIYSFSPDDESKVLFEKDKKPTKPDIEIIPRDKISSFTGNVVVKANIEMDSDARNELIAFLRRRGITVNPDTVSNRFTIENVNAYKNGVHQRYQTLWNLGYRVKSGRQQYYREPTRDQWSIIWSYVRSKLPDIAYFPTFVFDLPEKIYLHGKNEDGSNLFYRRIISDILEYQGDGLTIDDNIISRIHTDEFLTGFSEFLLTFWGSSAQQRITHALDLASATLTEVIINAWHGIFEEKISDKKIELDWKPEADPTGGNDHTLYVKFQVRQGTDRFDISDRSLGFRWFFCFLLFTQFRSHRKGGQGTLFLFDEPASNLHAKAQERLLKSFAEISQGPNSLVYSTHSQHMINPRWIDFSYIVENKDVDYNLSTNTHSVTSDKTDIRAVRYQTFVNENPGKASYYQPVLDRLEVKPSLLELRDGATLVEGKSDFYILRYMADRLGKNVVIVPAFGSTTFDVLIPLLMGFAKRFWILLDSDDAGKEAKARYTGYELSADRFLDFANLTGKREPEKLLSDNDLSIISNKMGISKKPSKKQIMRFFRQALSEEIDYPFSDDFRSACEKILSKISGIEAQ